MSCAMSKQVEFGEIDFEAIEYRNEYRYTNEFRHHTVFFNVAIFALPACVALWFLLMLLYGDALARLFGGFGLYGFARGFAEWYIQYRSRVIMSGQSLILKRPLLKDVEINYSEIDEVRVDGMVIRKSYASNSSAIDLSEAKRRWSVEEDQSVLELWSRDRKRKIAVKQSLENFDRFCDDLTERWRLAIDRYLGYAKGTSLRQPERYLAMRETLKAQREETLLKARSLSEIQKAGATNSPDTK